MLSDPDLKVGHLYRFVIPKECFAHGNINDFKRKELLNEGECRQTKDGKTDYKHLHEIRELLFPKKTDPGFPNHVDSLFADDEFFVIEIGRSFYSKYSQHEIQYQVITSKTIGWIFINKFTAHVEDITDLVKKGLSPLPILVP